MNKTIMMIMGGALVMALLVALVVSKLGGGAKPVGIEILVANKKLLIGEKLRAEDVRWQIWPEGALYSGVIKRQDQKDEKKLFVYDAPLSRTIESGEPIVQQAVITDAKGATNFLAANMKPGMRAVAVGVKPETAVAGFVGPGDYVDVILTYSPRMSGDLKEYASDVVQSYASETILSNVRVLAVDQQAKAGQGNADKKAKSAKTVTLEVDKAGAETMALAQSMGDITLSLRRMGEQDTAEDAKPTLTTDMSRSAVIKRVGKAMQDKKTATDTIRVYSGQSIQNVPVRASGQEQ